MATLSVTTGRQLLNEIDGPAIFDSVCHGPSFIHDRGTREDPGKSIVTFGLGISSCASKLARQTRLFVEY